MYKDVEAHDHFYYGSNLLIGSVVQCFTQPFRTVYKFESEVR